MLGTEDGIQVLQGRFFFILCFLLLILFDSRQTVYVESSVFCLF